MKSKRRDLIITIEEVIESYNPTEARRIGLATDYIDCVKTTKGYVSISESGEVEDIVITGSYILTESGNHKTKDKSNDYNIFEKVIRKLFGMNKEVNKC